MEFYNTERLYSNIGYLAPLEFMKKGGNRKIKMNEVRVYKYPLLGDRFAPGKTVDVVIPTYNGKDLLAANLPILFNTISNKQISAEKTANQGREPDSNIQIIIVDDASDDDTLTFLSEHFPEITVVSRNRRMGFGITANEGIAAGKGEIILLVNNDIQTTPNFLPPLMELFADPKVFAVCPRILTQDRNNPAQFLNETGFVIIFENNRLDQRPVPHDTMEKITDPVLLPYASGACVAYRRQVFEELGGFDRLFVPFYWEDVDLSYRALKRGYKILYQPKSTVYHQRNVTVNRFFKRKYVDGIFWKNLLLFTWKNLVDKDLWNRHLATLPIECFRALFNGKRRFILAVLKNLIRIRAIKQARQSEQLESILGDKELLE